MMMSNDDKNKDVIEDISYKCVLSKNALAYNLAYHLRNMKDGDNPYLIIEKVLDSFEKQS